jgi:hypothetical protein
MEGATVLRRHRLGARPDAHDLAALTGHAVGIRCPKADLVDRVGLEVEHAAGEHIWRRHVELPALHDPLALQPQQR